MGKGGNENTYKQRAKLELEKRLKRLDALLGSSDDPELSRVDSNPVADASKTEGCSRNAEGGSRNIEGAHAPNIKGGGRSRSRNIGMDAGDPEVAAVAFSGNASRADIGSAADKADGVRGGRASASRRAGEGAAYSGGKQARGKSGGAPNIHGGHRLRLRTSAARDVNLDGFSDVELAELLLTFFVPQKNVNEYAHSLLDEFGSLAGLLGATEEGLLRFSFITERAARLLPLLACVCIAEGFAETFIPDFKTALDFFEALFAVEDNYGMYFAYLAEDFRLVALEKADILRLRSVASAACKYGARYVFAARREREMFPDAFDLRSSVDGITRTLGAVGARLLDFAMFTDYGYYTLGSPPKAGEWYPLYVFVPSSRKYRYSEMISAAAKYFGDSDDFSR